MVRPDGAKVEELVVPSFCYKNHVSTDKRFGFVRRYLITSATAHDSRWKNEARYRLRSPMAAPRRPSKIVIRKWPDIPQFAWLG